MFWDRLLKNKNKNQDKEKKNEPMVAPLPDRPDDRRYGKGEPADKGVSAPLDGFAWDFFDAAADGNTVFSPFGLYSALGMLANAAEEGSPELEELLEAMHSDSLGSVNESMDAMLPVFPNSVLFRSSNLVLVSSELLKNGVGIDDGYREAMAKTFGGDVTEADFQKNLKGVRKDISEWVSEKTEGMIPDYQSVVTDETVTDILNAVCFKSMWTSPFEHESTRPETFTCADGHASEVDMMHQTERFVFGLHEGERYRGLRMGYGVKGSDAVMLLVIPSDPSDLNILRSWKSETPEFRREFLDSVMSARAANVSLSLPVLSMSADYDLKDVFEMMGMTRLASGNPGFERMLNGFPLAFGSGKHEALVKVDEEGTEAAAVTEVSILCGCCPPLDEPVRFRCNIPYLFVIADSHTGAYLFVGYVGSLEGKERRSHLRVGKEADREQGEVHHPSAVDHHVRFGQLQSRFRRFLFEEHAVEGAGAAVAPGFDLNGGDLPVNHDDEVHLRGSVGGPVEA
jgi:serpin B